ncbi:MAG: class I SAM-dependent methyltransferase [Chordicoccus sp.]
MSENEETRTTELGNPRRPEGEAGEKMLDRMNESHYAMTGWALTFLDIRPDDRLLDIGCGGGMTLNRIADQVTDGHLDGVDYSEVSVAKSASLNKAFIDQGRMTIQEGSVEALPFEDETFDKIITVESFYFWPDPAENLKEVYRVLKKGGHFLLVAETYDSPAMSDRERENVATYHLFNPTKEKFGELFANAGFEHVQIHTKSGEEWICIDGMRI